MDGIGPSARDWSPKFATGLNMIIGCGSKSIWVIKLSFFQNDPLMGESFWQNHRLVTHILFELQPIIIFSPVANFGDQSLALLYSYLAVQRKSTAAAGTRTWCTRIPELKVVMLQCCLDLPEACLNCHLYFHSLQHYHLHHLLLHYCLRWLVL